MYFSSPQIKHLPCSLCCEHISHTYLNGQHIYIPFIHSFINVFHIIVFVQAKNGRSDSTRAEDFFVEMRQLQSRNKCTDTTLYDIIETFSKYHDLDVPTRASLDKLDKQMQELAGCSFLELHGCPQGKTIRPGVKACGRFIYEPTDQRRLCPLCGAPRYDSKGRPHEVGIV